jgi:hypothetical protein
MNEIDIIRSQLALEQAHAAEVANACAAAFGSSAGAAASSEALARFREACVSYLVWVLARFEERDQTLSELLAARPPPAAAGAGASHPSPPISQAGTSREALSRLESALAAGDTEAARRGWEEFARFFNSAWAPRRAALERALAEQASVGEWRAVCAIDADSMLDERSRYARIGAQRPQGIELRPGPASPR